MKLKLHHNKNRLGLCPRPQWGAYSAPPHPLAGFQFIGPSGLYCRPFGPPLWVIPLFGFQMLACLMLSRLSFLPLLRYVDNYKSWLLEQQWSRLHIVSWQKKPRLFGVPDVERFWVDAIIILNHTDQACSQGGSIDGFDRLKCIIIVEILLLLLLHSLK